MTTKRIAPLILTVILLTLVGLFISGTWQALGYVMLIFLVLLSPRLLVELLLRLPSSRNLAQRAPQRARRIKTILVIGAFCISLGLTMLLIYEFFSFAAQFRFSVP